MSIPTSPVRRWRRLLLRVVPAESKTSARLGGASELLGQPKRGPSPTPLRYSKTLGMWFHSTGSVGQDPQVRGEEHSRFGGESSPHFESFPLLSSKQADVELFRDICLRMYNSEHKTAEGFEAIVKAAMKMNSSGKRKYSGSEILSSLTVR